MNADRWRAVKEILDGALERTEPEARALYLAGVEPGLRSEVESLLEHEAPSGTVFEVLAERSGVPESVGPESVGPWRVIREVGRGGMGVVYQARRDDGEYDQLVAIKLLEGARGTGEHRILARLEHPSIARLIDAGRTPAQQPYLVMEWVDGEPLSASDGLTMRQRLERFLKIAEAVGFAHRQLVVHLDLKPANILIKADGSPKLLDFGVSKLVDPETGASAGEQTAAFLRVLTPAYASPEQVNGGVVSVASDVYALGMVLYEYLTSRRPYDTSGLTSQQQIAQVVTTAIPPPAGVAQDVDLILSKALAKEAGERYRSVDELADDVRRYLRKEPIAARRPTWLYRTQQYARRNRLWFAGATVAGLGLLVGSVIAMQQARVAQRRFQQIRALTNSLIFEFHDAIQTLPGSAPAQALVLRRAGEYLDRLALEAGGDAGLRRDLAESYLKLGDVEGLYYEANLGQKEEARRNYQKGLALLEANVASSPLNPMRKLDLADAHIRLATSYSGAREVSGAIRHLQQALEIAGAIPLPIPPVKIALAKAHFGLAENYERANRIPEAIRERQTTIEIVESAAKFAAPAKRWVALAHKRYGATLFQHTPRLADALKEFELAEKMDEAASRAAPNNAVARADLALDRHYLAIAYRKAEQPEAARRELEAAVALHRQLVRDDRRTTRYRQLLTQDLEMLAGTCEDPARAAALRAEAAAVGR